jgi:hypothetical protein
MESGPHASTTVICGEKGKKYLLELSRATRMLFCFKDFMQFHSKLTRLKYSQSYFQFFLFFFE